MELDGVRVRWRQMIQWCNTLKKWPKEEEEEEDEPNQIEQTVSLQEIA